MDERKTCYRGFGSVTFADEISARNASKKQCYCWQWPNRHLCGLSSIKGKSLRSSLYRLQSGLGYCMSHMVSAKLKNSWMRDQNRGKHSGVRKDVKFWMMFRGSGCNTILNRVLCSNWFAPHSILNESCLKVFY
ncbi:hypothetical protein ACB094_12G073600 [Castanea mollissima]